MNVGHTLACHYYLSIHKPMKNVFSQGKTSLKSLLLRGLLETELCTLFKPEQKSK